jgi:isopentenyl diphosphate isomerase/L-lactate dehydrogenase-like FMN-dependent dehydrogenase
LALGGAEALTRVLEILEAEISTTMANIGCRSVADITPGHVRWSIPSPPV